MDAEHPLILESLRRNRRQYLLVAAICAPFGAFCLAAPWWSSEGAGVTWAVVGIGALCLAVGLYMTVLIRRHWPVERAPLVAILRERAGDIVWVYVQQVSSQAVGVTVARAYTIHVQLADGKGYPLSVHGSKRDPLMELLAQIAPAATFGYSRELARQYKRNPSSLSVATH